MNPTLNTTTLVMIYIYTHMYIYIYMCNIVYRYTYIHRAYKIYIINNRMSCGSLGLRADVEADPDGTSAGRDSKD